MTNARNGLTQGDLEQIERLIYENGDDIEVSVTRSLDRLQERISSTEARLYRKLVEIEGVLSLKSF